LEFPGEQLAISQKVPLPEPAVLTEPTAKGDVFQLAANYGNGFKNQPESSNENINHRSCARDAFERRMGPEPGDNGDREKHDDDTDVFDDDCAGRVHRYQLLQANRL
jgi:hypothetical protein